VRDSNESRSYPQRLRAWIGLVLFLLAFGVSTAYVFYQSFMVGETNLAGGRKEITFAHWQLEGRTVEAMNWAAAEYMKLHPDVYVRQIPIPGRGYNQWVRTQLIGRTAPDLIESYFPASWAVRYFSPVSDVVEKPNPYNKGTDLEHVPWRETYIDGMIGGLQWDLQEYYRMPLSSFTVRIYANQTLLEEAARFLDQGPVSEPKTLGELFHVCEMVKTYAKESGQRIVPIAGSDNTARMFASKYWGVAIWGLLDLLDTDYDGSILHIERYEAIMSGRLNLRTDPHVRAAYQVLFELSRFFNPGFMSAKRDQSVFLFAHGNAAMLATGSWDAGTLHRQVGGDFEITVFDFPVADPQNPKYGKYIRHRITEAGAWCGFPFSLSRHSPNRELAIDFMQFLSSRKTVEVDGKLVPMNEELNRRFRWFPATIGSEVDEMLKPFAPKVEGIYNLFSDTEFFGSAVNLSVMQNCKAYISEEEPSQREYEAYLARTGRNAKDFTYRRFLDDWRNKHYRQFIDRYAADIEREAPKDMLQSLQNTYTTIAMAERPIAFARNRAIRRSVSADPTGDIKRNLKSLISGQAKRIVELAEYKQRVDRANKNRVVAKGPAE